MIEVLINKVVPKIIELNNVTEDTPIFAIRNNEIKGMIIREGGAGWILKIGGGCDCNGCHTTRKKAKENASTYGYTFAIEVKVHE